MEPVEASNDTADQIVDKKVVKSLWIFVPMEASPLDLDATAE